MTEMKLCPFCKSNSLKLTLSKNVCGTNGLDWVVERHRWSVRCNQCKARGSIASGRVIPGHKITEDAEVAPWQTTDETLKRIAIELWNCRTGDMDVSIPRHNNCADGKMTQ